MRLSFMLTLAASAFIACNSNSHAEVPTPPDAETVWFTTTRVPVPASLDWRKASKSADEALPISLTAGDGTNLALKTVKVRSVVTDPLAFTELHLSFENPQDRTIEGRFEITLPPGAAISRFAMEVDGKWQEGEVVEKQFARRVYEDFLHQKTDPALLEKKAGNQFRARVFPIPAKGVKHLILSYSEELEDGSKPYQVNLSGLPELEQFDASVHVDDWDGAPRTLEVSRTEYRPEGNLRLAFGKAQSSVGVRSGDIAIARVQPNFGVAADPVNGLTVLFDTSASRAPGFWGQIERLQGTLAAIADEQGDIPVRVLAFDQDVREIYSGPATGFSDTHKAALSDRGALGASDLESALKHAGDGTVHHRLLLVTDGIVTAGDDEAGTLTASIEALGTAGVERIDVLVDGGIRDEALLTAMTRSGLARDGVVIEASGSLDEIAGRLGKATRSSIAVTVPGADWVWPATLDGVQPGDNVLVYAMLPENADVDVQFDGESAGEIAFADVARPLVQRAAAAAEISKLQQAESQALDDAERSSLKNLIVQLSTKHRVLSNHTALLVLETEEDYARFEIPRDSLANILVVEGDGLQLVDRAAIVVPDKPKQVVSKADTKSKKSEKRATDDGWTNEEQEEEEGDFTEMDGAPPPAPPTEAPAMVEQPEPSVMAQEERSVSRSAPTSGRRAPSMPRLTLGMASRDRASEPMSEMMSADEDDEGGSGQGRPGSIDPTAAWDGKFKETMVLLGKGKTAAAVAFAKAWHDEDPGDVLALIALGEALEASGDIAGAARAYGSIIDLFPSRADLRRMAGERLERLGAPAAELTVDTYTHAVEQRPDHPASHRLLAYALVKQGEHEAAFEAIRTGAERSYPDGRFRGVDRILDEDVGLIASAWMAADPDRAHEIEQLLNSAGGVRAEGESIRFILNWETDANDVDFHIYDSNGGHAYYSQPTLSSGGQLYADVTTGYGPECFTISKPGQLTYTLQAHYYTRGPMGYGMGKLQIIEHDGEGGLTFEERPFIVMTDGAYVELGTVTPGKQGA